MEPACKLSPSGILHLHFLPRPTAQENEVLKFPDLREEDAVLDSGAECAHTHMMQYVEVCELLAGAQETYYIMKQLAIFVTSTMNMVESFFSKARQHPGVPCNSLKFSSQLPASFLEEVVPVGMHTLQA